jgi:hypothetical protein
MHSMVVVAPNPWRHHLGTPGRLRRNPQMLDPDDERYLSRRPGQVPWAWASLLQVRRLRRKQTGAEKLARLASDWYSEIQPPPLLVCGDSLSTSDALRAQCRSNVLSQRHQTRHHYHARRRMLTTQTVRPGSRSNSQVSDRQPS